MRKIKLAHPFEKELGTYFVFNEDGTYMMFNGEGDAARLQYWKWKISEDEHGEICLFYATHESDMWLMFWDWGRERECSNAFGQCLLNWLTDIQLLNGGDYVVED